MSESLIRGDEKEGQQDSMDNLSWPLWARAFLVAYADGGVDLAAAKAVGVDRTTVWYLRKRDPTFQAAYEEAAKSFADKLEAEAIWRATNRDRPAASSDKLLITLLRAHKPHKYVDRNLTQTDITVRILTDGGQPETVDSTAHILDADVRQLESGEAADGSDDDTA